MANGKFVTYQRVSTDRQGQSGLGLEAQRAACLSYLNGGAWELVAEFVEVESGAKADRPQLAAAIAECKRTGSTLLIAKLDRLSRDAHFLLGLEKAGVEFVACDMPHANKLTIGIMALVAEEERRAISARTKAALAAARERGVKLGGYRGGAVTDEARAASAAVVKAKADAHADLVMGAVLRLRREGITSLAGIARGLNDRGVKTARGGAWAATTVKNLLARVEG